MVDGIKVVLGELQGKNVSKSIHTCLDVVYLQR